MNFEKSDLIKKKITIVDTSDVLEKKARDVANEKMTASKEELKGISGFFKRIWKFNLADEYYRQKEYYKTKADIQKSGNIFVNENDEIEAHEQAMKAIVERFSIDSEEMVHQDAGEEREIIIADKKEEMIIKDSIKGLINDYAMGKIDENRFKEEKKCILANLKKEKGEVIDKGDMYADNMLEVAKEVKQAIEHGKKLEELDFDFDLVIGRAKDGVRTEAQYNAIDRLVSKITKTKAGSMMLNETTTALALASVYCIGSIFSKKIANSKAMAWSTFGGTALVSGGIAGLKESKRLEDERSQHAREMTQGKIFSADEKEAPRRHEMEKFRYETVEAKNLIADLKNSLYVDGQKELKNLNQEEFNTALARLTDIESRIKLSDRQKIDLISFSNYKEVEKERTELDIARAQAKVDLRRAIAENPSLTLPGGTDLKTCLNNLNETRINNLIGGESGIEQKNKLFKKMKHKEVAKAVAKGIATGLIVGGLAQEGLAFLRSDQEGVIEHYAKELLNKPGSRVGNQDLAHFTPLEYLRRYMNDHDFPRMQPGKIHEVLIGNNHIKLPEGTNLMPDGKGGYNLIHGNGVVSEHLTFDKNGNLTDAAKGILKHDNVFTSSHTDQIVKPGAPATTEGFINSHENLFQRIKRDLWYDNNTPKPIFDKNELKLWWGGKQGMGVDDNGNYVFNIKHMASDGSYHGKFSVDAQEAMQSGKLKMLLSVSHNTQNQVFEVPINANGNAIIDSKSEIGKALFAVDGRGHTIFNGKFAEVAQMMKGQDGIDHAKILATHIGKEAGVFGSLPQVENIPITNLDVPIDYRFDPPPFIPVMGRRPLEKTQNKEEKDPRPLQPYIRGYFGSNPENIKLYQSRMSETIKNNPEAKLNQYQEIKKYFERQTEKWRGEVQELSSQITEPMDKNCKLTVCIPAAGHQEGKNIYRTLSMFKNQKNTDDTLLDPSNFEVIVFVNHPDDKAPDETRDEIKRFQQENPEIRVRVLYKTFKKEDISIGRMRKYVTDVALMRQLNRGESTEDLLISSNDADCYGLSEKYISKLIGNFSESNIEGVLGKIDWQPESYAKLPLLHFSTRFMQCIDAVNRHPKDGETRSVASSGANFSYKGSIYAAVGGYNELDVKGEDVSFGDAIKIARRNTANYPIKYDHSLSVYTSSRRAIDAIQKGLSASEQWRGEFGPNDSVRTANLLEEINSDVLSDLDNPAYINKLKEALEITINRTLVNDYRIDLNGAIAKTAYRNFYVATGIKLNVVNNRVVINEITQKTIEGLKKYQENWKTVIDKKTKSGSRVNNKEKRTNKSETTADKEKQFEKIKEGKIYYAEKMGREKNLDSAFSGFEKDNEELLKGFEGKEVLLKVNIVDPDHPQACTSAETIKKVIEQISKYKPKKILVGDIPSEMGKSGRSWEELKKIYKEKLGYDFSGNVELVNLEDLPETTIGNGAEKFTVKDISVFGGVMNISKPKMHGEFGFTGCTKNLMGFMTQKTRKEMVHKEGATNADRHANLGRFTTEMLKNNPNIINVSDGYDFVIGHEHFGPSKKTDFAMVTRDPINADYEAMKIIGLNENRSNYLKNVEIPNISGKVAGKVNQKKLHPSNLEETVFLYDADINTGSYLRVPAVNDKEFINNSEVKKRYCEALSKIIISMLSRGSGINKTEALRYYLRAIDTKGMKDNIRRIKENIKENGVFVYDDDVEFIKMSKAWAEQELGKT
jgi:uncharacterized protein (DUF362 family)